jgi:hypothetical protein
MGALPADLVPRAKRGQGKTGKLSSTKERTDSEKLLGEEAKRESESPSSEADDVQEPAEKKRALSKDPQSPGKLRNPRWLMHRIPVQTPHIFREKTGAIQDEFSRFQQLLTRQAVEKARKRTAAADHAKEKAVITAPHGHPSHKKVPPTSV